MDDFPVRELTFEEEAEQYIKEVTPIFEQEAKQGDCTEVNNVLRCGVRIIRKAKEEIERLKVYEKHAHWIYTGIERLDDIPKEALECSLCGYYDFDIRPDTYKYCPSCGALMDEVTDDD